jgi:hypothetical protein
VYTDATLTKILKSRAGPQHRVTDTEFH